MLFHGKNGNRQGAMREVEKGYGEAGEDYPALTNIYNYQYWDIQTLMRYLCALIRQNDIRGDKSGEKATKGYTGGYE